MINRTYKFFNIEISVGNCINLTFLSECIINNKNMPKYLLLIVQVKDINQNIFTIGQRRPLNRGDNSSIENYINYLKNGLIA